MKLPKNTNASPERFSPHCTLLTDTDLGAIYSSKELFGITISAFFLCKMKMIGKNFKLGQFKFCLSFCPTWTRIMNDGAFTKKTCIINLEISTNLITMWGFLFWNIFFYVYLQIWPLHGKNTKPLELVEMLTTKTCNINLEISKMNQLIS